MRQILLFSYLSVMSVVFNKMMILIFADSQKVGSLDLKRKNKGRIIKRGRCNPKSL